MIEFSRSYRTSDGKCYATLGEAQATELMMLLKKTIGEPDESLNAFADAILANKDDIIEILTLSDSSRPKARGVPKKRKPKADAQIKVA